VTSAASPLKETPAPEPSEEAAARAHIYSLLGTLLATPPDAALLDRLKGIDAPDTGAAGLAPGWAALKQAAQQTTPEALAEEYQDLFIGLGRGEIVPYGSWYLTGLLMGEPLVELRGELAAIGLRRQDEVAEPEDHAAALCESMAFIILAEDPGVAGRQQAFFERYLQPWMGRFFEDLGKAQSARFYASVALFGARFIDIETTYLSMPV